VGCRCGLTDGSGASQPSIGPVEIGGSARLHQRDNHIKNIYYIDTAVFSLPEGLHWPNDGTAASGKQYHVNQDGLQDRCACKLKQCRVGEQKVREQCG